MQEEKANYKSQLCDFVNMYKEKVEKEKEIQRKREEKER